MPRITMLIDVHVWKHLGITWLSPRNPNTQMRGSKGENESLRGVFEQISRAMVWGSKGWTEEPSSLVCDK
ncbi:hypothetical protein HAV15_004468 [Penicillium sp. str. |nr:hypothetical protein HAV15_004468 [Penicillium sp. str. \